MGSKNNQSSGVLSTAPSLSTHVAALASLLEMLIGGATILSTMWQSQL